MLRLPLPPKVKPLKCLLQGMLDVCGPNLANVFIKHCSYDLATALAGSLSNIINGEHLLRGSISTVDLLIRGAVL
jgi:hypothetical protein